MSSTNGNGGGPRVAITGIGAVTPLGLDAESTWQSCRRGRGGIGPITAFDASHLTTQIAGQVKGFDPEAVLGKKEARRMSRCTQLAVFAARQAIEDSGLDIRSMAEDVGVLVASGVGGIEVIERNVLALYNQGPRRVSPFTVPSMIIDMPAGAIAIECGAKGVNYAIVSACASSGHAIGEAAEWIRRGEATAIITGGTEASITNISVAAFDAMQALSTRNDEPERASRPFDKDRDGFVMGEGAGMFVLEDWGHAVARGARIYGEVAGYGATADAYHITQPDEQGDGARRCILRSLKRAGRGPDEVDYINAHGTSTQMNDAAETKAVKAALGEVAGTIPMSSTKSMHGHLLGAAGAVEAVITVLAIRDQFVPPTINLDEPDPECDLDYVPNHGRDARIDFALSTSYGFGGHNVCLALARADGA
ncbi:MAG TPA: beta-ketoacyl-ACP synthase II [Candidatus Acidoferrales bacterium]|nr:beta-ketoacyl-ACP synthase II [Candidatus Acidoferrales bacterium]